MGNSQRRQGKPTGKLSTSHSATAAQASTAAQDDTTSPGPFCLSDIVSVELLRIEERRRYVDGPNRNTAGGRIQDTLCGLALSGGGIRSATYCLGVLQALASARKLGQFDYLSSVSGGGYIAAWWLRWVCRQTPCKHGFAGGDAPVAPTSTEDPPATANLGTKPACPPFPGADDPAIAHLRDYSNYLTPRKTVTSADTWRAGVLLLGNHVVTLAVLVPFLLAMVLAAQICCLVLLGGRFLCGSSFATNTLINACVSVAPGAEDAAAWQLIIVSAGTLVWCAVVLLPLRLLRSGVTSRLFQRVSTVSVLVVCLVVLSVSTRLFPDPDTVPLLQVLLTLTASLVALFGILPAFCSQGDQPDNAMRAGVFEQNLSWRRRIADQSLSMIIRAQIWFAGLAVSVAAILAFAVFGHRTRIHDLQSMSASHGQEIVTLVVRGVLALVAALQASLVRERRQQAKPSWWTPFLPTIATVVAAAAMVFFGLALAHISWELLAAAYVGAIEQIVPHSQPAPPFVVGILRAVLLVTTGLLLLCAVHEGVTEDDAGYETVTDLLKAAVVNVWSSAGGAVTYAAGAVAFSMGVARLARSVYVVAPAAVGGVVVLLFVCLWHRRKSDVQQPGHTLGKFTPEEMGRVGIAVVAFDLGCLLGASAAITSSMAGYTLGWGALHTTDVGPPLATLRYTALGLLLLSGAVVAAEFIVSKRKNWRALGLATFAASVQVAIVSATALRDPLTALAAAIGWTLVATLLITAIGVGWLTDVNDVSWHGFYRDRLVSAYLRKPLPRGEGHATVDPLLPAPADDLKLVEQEATVAGAPYHLINATESLVGGRDLETAQRGGASFLLSPEYCGSTRAKFRKSSEYMGGKMTLGTAIAISGAAASPTMGVKTPSLFATMVLTLANVRLGYWAPEPTRTRWRRARPRLWPFYVLREFLASTAGGSPYTYLTDGGHFDNTGIYSLVQRGCRLIIAVDCGADHRGVCADIGDVVRRCRTEFDVTIDFDSLPAHALGTPGRNSCRFGVGRITYPLRHLKQIDPAANKERAGVLIWIKPGVSDGDAIDLKQYAAEHPSFPNLSTVQQWFDRQDFEAYRALGYSAGQDLCAHWPAADDTAGNWITPTSDSRATPSAFGRPARSKARGLSRHGHSATVDGVSSATGHAASPLRPENKQSESPTSSL